ncbi:MAG: multidrug transporter [Sphingopyxis sp.]|nr:multidrug transporter [Sphingopyxis sp.]
MTLPRLRGLAMLLAGSATLTACASVPDLGARPEIAIPQSIASAASLSADAAEWPAAGWWQGYGDAQLDTLMREAIAGSPDLRMAAARLRQADAYARQAGAALAPQIDATSSAGFVQQSENNGVPGQFVPDGWESTAKVGIGFSLDLDLWGKNRATLAAAKSDALAARYEVEEAQLTLTAAIASSYAELARLHAQRDVLGRTVQNRLETLKLVSDRVFAGLDNQAALKQARSRVPAAKAELAATDEAIALTKNSIAALTGAGPDRALTISRPAVALENVRSVPSNASIDLVGRRPDIAAALAAVDAQSSRIKAARAAFYPNINLSGLIGLQSLGIGNLAQGSSLYGNAGPAISLPIFHGGAISAQYRGTRAQYDEAVARYDATVIAALNDVADTLVSRRALGDRLAYSLAAMKDAESAHALSRQRYERGLSSYLDVLSNEENVLQARRSVADLQARAFTLDVQMVRSLGGGFTKA